MDTWNPTQYAKFECEREQPFFDLLALVQPAPGMRVVDLGCGTGRLTHHMHGALGARETVGIDRSERMLEVALRQSQAPDLRFEVGTVESFRDAARSDDRYDLIFSNAAFHWVEHHSALIQHLAERLAPAGQLAFQVPAMHDTPSHSLPDKMAEAEPFRTAFGGWTRPQPVLEIDRYARLLFQLGFVDQTVRLTIYPHVLASREDVVEWTKGTLLTEYEKRLTPPLFSEFAATYRERLLAVLPPDRPFFFPFKRILCWGRKR
jgi:trans-aconitate 2-methyltransferase